MASAASRLDRELRHSFVSVLSDAGVPVEQISQLVGHSGTTVTELVYRHQLRPVLQKGATVTDRIFNANRRQAGVTGAGERAPQGGADQGCCWWAILGSNQ